MHYCTHKFQAKWRDINVTMSCMLSNFVLYPPAICMFGPRQERCGFNGGSMQILWLWWTKGNPTVTTEANDSDGFVCPLRRQPSWYTLAQISLTLRGWQKREQQDSKRIMGSPTLINELCFIFLMALQTNC